MIGVLTDMAWQCEAQGITVDRAGEPDLTAMEAALDRLPCKPLDYRNPAEVTRAFLAACPGADRLADPGDGGGSVLRLVR